MQGLSAIQRQLPKPVIAYFGGSSKPDSGDYQDFIEWAILGSNSPPGVT